MDDVPASPSDKIGFDSDTKTYSAFFDDSDIGEYNLKITAEDPEENHNSHEITLIVFPSEGPRVTQPEVFIQNENLTIDETGPLPFVDTDDLTIE